MASCKCTKTMHKQYLLFSELNQLQAEEYHQTVNIFIFMMRTLKNKMVLLEIRKKKILDIH